MNALFPFPEFYTVGHYYGYQRNFLDLPEELGFKGPDRHPAGKVETHGQPGKEGRPGRSKKHRKPKTSKKAK
jgi:hypothetical protein